METEQEKFYRLQNEKTAAGHRLAKDQWKATKWFFGVLIGVLISVPLIVMIIAACAVALRH